MGIELKEDVLYKFGDIIIKPVTDYDFNLVVEIIAEDGKIIVLPSSNNKVAIKSTVDK